MCKLFHWCCQIVNSFCEENDLDLGGDMGGGDWGGDLDLGDLGGLPDEPVHVEERGVNLTLGDSCQAKWLKKRRLPCDLVAAGDFEEALNLLKRRLGLINAEPLAAIFKEAYWATCSSLTALPQMPSIHWPLLSEGSAKVRDLSPKILFTPQVILDRAREALRMVTSGKFNDALNAFRSVLQAIPISVANDANEERQLTEMIDTCREYVNFARLQVDPETFFRKLRCFKVYYIAFEIFLMGVFLPSCDCSIVTFKKGNKEGKKGWIPYHFWIHLPNIDHLEVLLGKHSSVWMFSLVVHRWPARSSHLTKWPRSLSWMPT